MLISQQMQKSWHPNGHHSSFKIFQGPSSKTKSLVKKVWSARVVAVGACKDW